MNIEELINDYKGGMGIYDVCEKYHIGKLKLKSILSKNGVELRKKGKQPMNKSDFKIADYRVKKYKEREGFHYVAIDKNNGIRYNDYMNSGGKLTTHIRNEYGVETPTLYDRRIYYMKTRNYWWEQWFDIVEEKDEENVRNIVIKRKKKDKVNMSNLENNSYSNLKFGFLREDSRRASFNGSEDIYKIKRTGLEKYLEIIFPTVKDWIHDEPIGDINGEKYRFRPDYRSEELKLIIEFDGVGHYNNPITIVDDEKKTLLYESGGYKVIRIPYFIQLTNDVVNDMFGVKVEEDLFPSTIPSMLIKWKNTPAFMCPLGVERMAKELIKCPQQLEINLLALENECVNHKNGLQLSGYHLLKKEISKQRSLLHTKED